MVEQDGGVVDGMHRSGSMPEERYAELVGWFTAHTPATWEPPDMGTGRRAFGSGALKVDGRIFAMLSRDRLVVKLPEKRVEALAGAGEGVRFDPGHGRIMREWLSLDPSSGLDWRALAGEAMEFVGTSRRAVADDGGGTVACLTAALLDESTGSATPVVQFNANSLKSNNKMFANFSHGALVVKLPPGRVDELVAAGAGERQDVGTGPLKEWLVVPASNPDRWLPLAREAIAYAGPKRR